MPATGTNRGRGAPGYEHSRSYDEQMGRWDRKLLAETRAWICWWARGQVLEIAPIPLGGEHFRRRPGWRVLFERFATGKAPA